MALNKKTLAAQSLQKQDQAERATRFATVSNENAERARAAIQGGLGSDYQLRGGYSGATGPGSVRDLSKYSTGLLYENDYLGGAVQAWRDLKLQGRDPNAVAIEAKYNKQGVLKRGEQTWGDLALQQQGESSLKKNVGDTGGAQSRVRQFEIAGQITQVEDTFQAMRTAAEAGDFETADAKYAEAMGLVNQFGLNEHFDPTGLANDAAGLSFSTGAKFDPLADTAGQAAQALGSPTGMLVGQMVHRANALQDPNSPESLEFKDALSSGALAAVDAARKNAMRAMATEERGAARNIRDMRLQTGVASSTGRTIAIAARSAERFATQRAGLETNVGAARAQIFSDTAKAYEQFRTDFAKDSVALSSAWVNDQSGVRDSFRAMQMNMAMNWSSNLMGFASNAQNNATRLVLGELGDVDTGGWQGAAGGALGGASAGAAAGPWGALAGGVLGGVAGYFS